MACSLMMGMFWFFLCNAMQCNAVHSLVDNDESGEIRTRRFSFRSFLTLLFLITRFVR